MTFLADRALESPILRETKDKIDIVLCAPTHDVVPADAAVASDNDSHIGPHTANLRDDAVQLSCGSRSRIDVRWTQLRAQQEFAAENVQRQIAIAFVVTVEETAQLPAMQWIVGGVDVQHDLCGRLGVHRQKDSDEEPLDSDVTGDDLLVAARRAGTDRRQFQPVQRIATGQRLAPIPFASAFLAGQVVTSTQQCHQRIVPQLVMIVEVFVAQRDAHHTLGEQLFDWVLDQFPSAMVLET